MINNILICENRTLIPSSFAIGVVNENNAEILNLKKPRVLNDRAISDFKTHLVFSNDHGKFETDLDGDLYPLNSTLTTDTSLTLIVQFIDNNVVIWSSFPITFHLVENDIPQNNIFSLSDFIRILNFQLETSIDEAASGDEVASFLEQKFHQLQADSESLNSSFNSYYSRIASLVNSYADLVESQSDAPGLVFENIDINENNSYNRSKTIVSVGDMLNDSINYSQIKKSLLSFEKRINPESDFSEDTSLTMVFDSIFSTVNNIQDDRDRYKEYYDIIIDSLLDLYGN